MGALPNFQPQTKQTRRKPAGKAVKPAEPCAPRTLPQIQAEFRSRTNYEKGTGYFPIFHALLEDIFRLSSGLSCTNLIFAVVQDMSIRSQGTHAIPEDAEMSVDELAMRIRCDARQVNRVLEYLVVRKMAVVARLADSRFVITLLFKQWGAIELSYEQWDAVRKAKEAQENPAEEPETEAEVIAVKKGTVPLTRRPVCVKAGERSRPLKVNTGVRSFRVHWRDKVLDLKFEAAVISGELVLTGDLPKSESLKRNADAKPVKSTSSGKTSGHGCPENAKSPANEGRQKPPLKGEEEKVKHPRAAELSKLFDPLIWASCKMTLSGDPKYLQQACELIGETPQDTLIKAAVERAAKTIKPHQIPAICRQIRHDWEQGRLLPGAAKPAPALTKGGERAAKLIQGLDMLDRIRGKK